MFEVGTVQRHPGTGEDKSKFDLKWPVVFEDETEGFVGGVVALRDSREAAGALQVALNAALQANP